MTMKSDWPFSWIPATKYYEEHVIRHGGAATGEPFETKSGHTEVVYDRRALAAGSTWEAEAAYGIPFDQDVTIVHELGHGLSHIDDKSQYFNVWSVETENQLTHSCET